MRKHSEQLVQKSPHWHLVSARILTIVKCHICDPWHKVSPNTASRWFPAVKNHLIIHCTNASRSVRTHMQTIISLWDTQRASVGSLTDTQLPFFTSREKFITAEPWHLKVTGELESGEICCIFMVYHIFCCILFLFLYPVSQIEA